MGKRFFTLEEARKLLPSINDWMGKARSLASQIQKSGCVLKSIEEGLVDFPHLKNGREVYLCWKYGEDDIRFWHEVDSGFGGRNPISD